MALLPKIHFSGTVTVFQERVLPERATPAGYAALIDAYRLKVPRHRTLSATGEHHRIRNESGWRILTPSHKPFPMLEGHLTFALKYEGLDLAALKRLFATVGPRQIEAVVQSKPTGTYARRIWFLYEWLLGKQLDLPDAQSGSYAEVVEEQQWAIKGDTSPRHRLWNNLPGTPAFCPLVFPKESLQDFAPMGFPSKGLAPRASRPC